ncbi:MAG: hypothetical protein ACUVT7_01910 [Thermoplasmata archaeon]
MVIVRNILTEGASEYATIMIALSLVFQIALYPFYAYFTVAVASDWVPNRLRPRRSSLSHQFRAWKWLAGHGSVSNG